MTCPTPTPPAGWSVVPEDNTCTTTYTATCCVYPEAYDLRVVHGFRYEAVNGGSIVPIGFAQAPLLGGSPVGGTDDTLYWGTETLG